MYARRTTSFAGGLTGGRMPVDLIALVAFVFLTFCLQFFESTAPFLSRLRLSNAVWQRGEVWRVLTYPFVGFGAPSLWILLQLAMLLWFGRDIYVRLGRKRFWRVLVLGALVAAAVALGVEALFGPWGWWPTRSPYLLLQGQQLILALLVAAFATLYRSATISLMFVLPISAAWFIPIELLLAFLGFLWSKDLAGFLGLAAGIGFTWAILSPNRAQRAPKELALRLRRLWYELRLARMKRRRGLKVIEGGKGKPPGRWVN